MYVSVTSIDVIAMQLWRYDIPGEIKIQFLTSFPLLYL